MFYHPRPPGLVCFDSYSDVLWPLDRFWWTYLEMPSNISVPRLFCTGLAQDVAVCFNLESCTSRCRRFSLSTSDTCPIENYSQAIVRMYRLESACGVHNSNKSTVIQAVPYLPGGTIRLQCQSVHCLSSLVRLMSLVDIEFSGEFSCPVEVLLDLRRQAVFQVAILMHKLYHRGSSSNGSFDHILLDVFLQLSCVQVITAAAPISTRHARTRWNAEASNDDTGEVRTN